MRRFWGALVGSLVLTLVALGGAGYALSRMLVSPPPAKLRTATFEMDLAAGWKCDLETTEYVCYPPGEPPHDAIAIVAAKYRNAIDSLDAYEAHISTPQASLADERPGRLATIHHVKRRAIAGYEWVEGLHFGSEVPTFYTYYLATVTSHIGILVTLSADSGVFRERREDFQRMLESLVVYQSGES